MTPDAVISRLAGDPTFDLWDQTKQLWFCGRVVFIHSAIVNMKGPNYNVPLTKLKSSLRKTIAMLESFGGMEIIDYLAEGHNGNITRAMAELHGLNKTMKRLLAMPKPDHLIELTTDPGEEPEVGYSGGDGPGGRRKWRNAVVTEMVHALIEDAGVSIARTGRSIHSEGSPSMKLMRLPRRPEPQNRHGGEADRSH
jgi:hypothetical protein